VSAENAAMDALLDWGEPEMIAQCEQLKGVLNEVAA
jgi:hypothetical protein